MKLPFILENLKSRYCQLVLLGSLILGYLLIPKRVLAGPHRYIAIIFMITFALTTACIARSIKEKVKNAQTYKNSTLGLLASILGISTLQVCGLGTPICGAGIGMGVMTAVAPGILVYQVESHSEIILAISILAQIFSVYKMNCFSSSKKI